MALFRFEAVVTRGKPTPEQIRRAIHGEFQPDDYPGESPFKTKVRDKIAAEQEEKKQKKGQK